MGRYLSACAFMCVLFFTSGISLATEKNSLLDIYYKSIQYYPELEQNNIDILRAKEITKQSKSSLFPAISVEAGSKYSYSKAGDATSKAINSSININITQPIIDLTKWSVVDQSKLAEHKAELNYRLSLQKHILKTAKYYFNVLISKSSFKEAQSQEYALQQYKNQVKEMHLAGYSQEFDVLEAEAAYETAKAMSLDKKLEIEVNIKFLESLIGQPIQDINKLSNEVRMQQFVMDDLPSLINKSRENNLAIKIANLEIQEQENLLSTNKRKHLPVVSTSSKIERTLSHQYATDNTATAAANNFEVGVSFAMPLYVGGKTVSEVKESSLSLDKYYKKLETITIETNLEIKKLFTKMQTSIEILEARHKSVIASEKNLKSTHHSYEIGTKNITDVLNARQKVFSARLQYLVLKYGIISDYLQMKFLSGDISEDDIKLLNQYLK